MAHIHEFFDHLSRFGATRANYGLMIIPSPDDPTFVYAHFMDAV